MRTRKVFILALIAVGIAAIAAGAAEKSADCCKVPWGYEDPGRWPEVRPCFSPCKGGEQSPIDVENPLTTSLPPLEFSYGTLSELPVENNGHTVEAKVSEKEPDDKVTLRIQGVDYRLVQFHFHTPS